MIKFLGAMVLIIFGVGLFYGGQLLMEQRAENKITAAAASIQAQVLKAQQDNINAFIAQHK